MKHWLIETREFLVAWGNWFFKRGYKWFARFEKVKDTVTLILYRQRGRFSRPIVHISMGGLIATGVALAPVLANSFPGMASDPWIGESPSSVMVQLTDSQTTTRASDKVGDRVVDYVVKAGDSVSKIAEKFGVDSDTIRWENNLTSVNDIKPGQTLRVLPVSGIAHKVARGETIYTISKKYEASSQAIVDYPFNNFSDDETFALSAGQTLIVPGGKKPAEIPWSPSLYVRQTTPNAGSVAATGRFAWPMGGIITQNYAWYHKGVDIATSYGATILAADAGRVVVAGWPDNTGYGNRVMIDHGNGFVTLYGHMSVVKVAAGQTVNRGDPIGLEGSTGRSTGPHLHFEIRRSGAAINPMEYLR